MNGLLIFLAALLLVVLTVVARGVRSVPQGFQWTVERFGRYRVTLDPGLHLINPFIDNIGRKVNVQETVLEVPARTIGPKIASSMGIEVGNPTYRPPLRSATLRNCRA